VPLGLPEIGALRIAARFFDRSTATKTFQRGMNANNHPGFRSATEGVGEPLSFADRPCVMSDLSPKADIRQYNRAASFNHLVGHCEQCRRHSDAKRVGGLEIDDKLIFCRRLHRLWDCGPGIEKLTSGILGCCACAASRHAAKCRDELAPFIRSPRRQSIENRE